MKKSIKIPWREFVESALNAEDGIYLKGYTRGAVHFLRDYLEPREIAELPDFVEVILEPKV